MKKGTYEIWMSGKKADWLQINENIVLKNADSFVEIGSDGRIEIVAPTDDKLKRMESLTTIALRFGDEWLHPYTLSRTILKDSETGSTIFSSRISVFVQNERTLIGDRSKFILNKFSKADTDILTFLVLATNMLYTGAFEATTLVALIPLEVLIHRKVKHLGKKFKRARMRDKIEYLHVRGIFSEEVRNDAMSLWKLRGELAHGSWKGEKLAKAIARTIGNKYYDQKLTRETTKKIIDKIMKVLPNIL